MGLLLPALVATIVSFAFGALWYGPFFGKTWMKLNKMKKAKPTAQPMVFAFLRQLVTAVVIALILHGVDLTSAVLTISLLWLAFTAMPALGDVIWAKRPLKLYAINTVYELGSVVLMTIVLTWF